MRCYAVRRVTVSDNQKSSAHFMKFVARININSINVSPSFEYKLLRNACVITKVYVLLGQPSYKKNKINHKLHILL